MTVAVIGAGIIGTSSAYLIKKRFPNLDVVVISKDFSPNLTSDGAAGLWTPYIAGDTDINLLKRWSKLTYDYCRDRIKNDPTSGKDGLYSTHGYKISKNETTEVPYWSDIPFDFKMLSKDDMKRFPESYKSGYSFTTVFIEGSKIIPYYSKKFIDLGGRFVKREVSSLDEISDEYDLIVNCSGLGSKALLNDDKVAPVRGQIMKVRAPWIREFIMTDNMIDNRTTYILPNQDFVVLGGTAYVGSTNLSVDEEDKKKILEGCIGICPSLEHAEFLEDWVGLRPSRSTMRLEKEDIVTVKKDGRSKTLKVVHNYGHGGSGLTVHYGCAVDAVELVTQSLAEVYTMKSKL